MKKWTKKEIDELINKFDKSEDEYIEKALNGEIPDEVIGYFASQDHEQDKTYRKWLSKAILQRKNYQIFREQANYMLYSSIIMGIATFFALISIVINIFKY